MVLVEVGILWIFLEMFKELVHSWKLPVSSPKASLRWSLILPSVCWTLWLKRNQRSFENYVEPLFKAFASARKYGVFGRLIVKSGRGFLL